MKDVIKLRLVPVQNRTDVLCVACNNFKADMQFMDTHMQRLEFGVHRRCYDEVHARRTPSGSSSME